MRLCPGAHSSPSNLHWADFLVRSFSRKNWFPLLSKWSSYSSQNLLCRSWEATVVDLHLLDTRDPVQYTSTRFPKRCSIVTSPRNFSAFQIYLRKPNTFGPSHKRGSTVFTTVHFFFDTRPNSKVFGVRRLVAARDCQVE